MTDFHIHPDKSVEVRTDNAVTFSFLVKDSFVALHVEGKNQSSKYFLTWEDVKFLSGALHHIVQNKGTDDQAAD